MKRADSYLLVQHFKRTVSMLQSFVPLVDGEPLWLMKSIEDFLEPSQIGDTGSVARFRERSSGQPQRGESQ